MQSLFLLTLFLAAACAQIVPVDILTCNVNISREAKKSYGFVEDAYLNLTELAEKYGYPVEEHEVVTADGYILRMFRIPHGRKRSGKKTGPPVMMVHTNEDSPDTWIFPGPGYGLGYQLADAGYDVWLASYRGGRYTRRHVRMNPDTDVDFWKFTSEDMAKYDLPAQIERVLRETGRESLAYVGHSLGCRIFLQMGPFTPEIYAKVNAMTCLGPLAFFGNINHPIMRLLASMTPMLEPFGVTLGLQEFFGSDSLLTGAMQLLCASSSRFVFLNRLTKQFCTTSLFLVMGDGYDQLREELIPVIFGHFPSGGSLQTFVELGKGINSKRFQRFDHGIEGNMKAYGRPEPPEYDVSKVSTPVSIIIGKNDLISSMKDSDTMRRRLPNVVDFYVIPRNKWQHSDYVWGREAPRLIGDRIIRMLSKYAV